MKKMTVYCHRNCNGHLIGCGTEEFAETTRMLKGLTALTLSFLSTESAYCQPGTYFRRWLENWGLPMGPLTQRSMFDKSPETSFARLSSWTRRLIRSKCAYASITINIRKTNPNNCYYCFCCSLLLSLPKCPVPQRFPYPAPFFP